MQGLSRARTIPEFELSRNKAAEPGGEPGRPVTDLPKFGSRCQLQLQVQASVEVRPPCSRSRIADCCRAFIAASFVRIPSP
jgi:hypothetical protein